MGQISIPLIKNNLPKVFRMIGIFATRSAILNPRRYVPHGLSLENPWKISLQQIIFLERTKFQKLTVLDVPYELQIIL